MYKKGPWAAPPGFPGALRGSMDGSSSPEVTPWDRSSPMGGPGVPWEPKGGGVLGRPGGSHGVPGAQNQREKTNPVIADKRVRGLFLYVCFWFFKRLKSFEK